MRPRYRPESTMANIHSDSSSHHMKQLATEVRSFYNGKVVSIDDKLKLKRIMVEIERYDTPGSQNSVEYCYPLFPNNIFCLPQVGEYVIVVPENIWRMDGRKYYFGPFQYGYIAQMDHDQYFSNLKSESPPTQNSLISDDRDIAILGRNGNGITVHYGKSISINTDILSNSNPRINLDSLEKKIDIIADSVLLASEKSNRTPESIVYGETLASILKDLFDILTNHKHPPNGTPYPNDIIQFKKLGDRVDKYLLNKEVKSR